MQRSPINTAIQSIFKTKSSPKIEFFHQGIYRQLSLLKNVFLFGNHIMHVQSIISVALDGKYRSATALLDFFSRNHPRQADISRTLQLAASTTHSLHSQCLAYYEHSFSAGLVNR